MISRHRDLNIRYIAGPSLFVILIALSLLSTTLLLASCEVEFCCNSADCMAQLIAATEIPYVTTVVKGDSVVQGTRKFKDGRGRTKQMDATTKLVL